MARRKKTVEVPSSPPTTNGDALDANLAVATAQPAPKAPHPAEPSEGGPPQDALSLLPHLADALNDVVDQAIKKHQPRRRTLRWSESESSAAELHLDFTRHSAKDLTCIVYSGPKKLGEHVISYSFEVFGDTTKSRSTPRIRLRLRLRPEGQTTSLGLGTISEFIGTGEEEITREDGESLLFSGRARDLSLTVENEQFYYMLRAFFPSSAETKGKATTTHGVRTRIVTDLKDSAVKADGWPRFTGSEWETQLPSWQWVPGSNGPLSIGVLRTEGLAWLDMLLGISCFALIQRHYLLLPTDPATDKSSPVLLPAMPDLRGFQPGRPVSLDPRRVNDDLTQRKLRIPHHVLESACAALNMGKNLILTGPPGCGKSKLASALAKLAVDRPPLLATASSAWTTGDLIGRYLPDHQSQGLFFQPGLFLQAIEARSWLVLDELNRCDVDQCFGELFSVLANDAVVLPFQSRVEGTEDEKDVFLPIRILPPNRRIDGKFRNYQVPETFRIIGTMNDADRVGLNQLSYALQRRFAIIPVEAPPPVIIREIIDHEIKEVSSQLMLEAQSWIISGNRKGTSTTALLDLAKEELHALFAPVVSDEASEVTQGLVASGIVGVSIILDIIRFIGEGLRTGSAQPQERKLKCPQEASQPEYAAEDLVLSYLALALVLFVFPQLETLQNDASEEGDLLLSTTTQLLRAFVVEKKNEDRRPEGPGMYRVEVVGGNKPELTRTGSINAYLLSELAKRFPAMRTAILEDIPKRLRALSRLDSGELI